MPRKKLVPETQESLNERAFRKLGPVTQAMASFIISGVMSEDGLTAIKKELETWKIPFCLARVDEIEKYGKVINSRETVDDNPLMKHTTTVVRILKQPGESESDFIERQDSATRGRFDLLGNLVVETTNEEFVTLAQRLVIDAFSLSPSAAELDNSEIK